MNSDFTPLSVNKTLPIDVDTVRRFMRTYQQATRKLLFIHYDGLINNAMDSAQPLFKLRQHLPAARAFNTSDIEFARVATDASDCCPGDLYIAIVTGDGDGHNDIELAIANGAVGILSLIHI